jgi:hypothetical protein
MVTKEKLEAGLEANADETKYTKNTHTTINNKAHNLYNLR